MALEGSKEAGKSQRGPVAGRPGQPSRPALVSLADYTRIQRTGGMLLIGCAALALVWANSPWSASYFRLWETELAFGLGRRLVSRPLDWWINEGLMAFFFFVAGLEIKRQILVGELSSPREGALPIIAALGGMICPALIYGLINRGGPGGPGFGIPMATDIAFAVCVLGLLGRRAPPGLVAFLTALAIVDDIGAIVLVIVFYSAQVQPPAVLAAGLILAGLIAANRLGVRPPLVYGLLGLGLWLAFLAAGVHATMAGVLVALTVPARARVRKDLFETGAEFLVHEFAAQDRPGQDVLGNVGQEETLEELISLAEAAEAPLQRLERHLSPRVSLILLPLFALANAGLALGDQFPLALGSPVGLGVFLGLCLGKSSGVTLFAWLAVRSGLARLPRAVNWPHIYGAAWLAAMGFTMSLLITDLAFETGPLSGAAKIGVFSASTLGAAVGLVVLAIAGRNKGRPASGRAAA